MKSEGIAIVRALESFKVALPEKDLIVRKEDVLTLDIHIAHILAKERKVEIIMLRVFQRGEAHDMDKYRQKDMANVEA